MQDQWQFVTIQKKTVKPVEKNKEPKVKKSEKIDFMKIQQELASLRKQKVSVKRQTYEELEKVSEEIANKENIEFKEAVQNTKQKVLEDQYFKKNTTSKQDCGVCYGNQNLKKIGNCGHMFCVQCIKGCLEFQMKKRSEHKEVFRCPDEECKDGCIDFLLFAEIYQVNFILDKVLSYQVFSEKKLPDFMDMYRVMICARGKCNKVFVYNKNQKKELVCHKCRVSYDPKTQVIKSDYNQKQIEEMAKLRLLGFMRCPACAFWVERTEGCPDMLCSCGYNFCYDCGQKMRDHYYCGLKPDRIQQLVMKEAQKQIKGLEEGDQRVQVLKDIQNRIEQQKKYQEEGYNEQW